MPKQELVDAILRDTEYDHETGHFVWKVATHSRGGLIEPGDIAGGRTQGYVQLCRNGSCLRAHRLAWFVMTGGWPPEGMDIDHINGIRDDNRWSNLRLATRTQNNLNGGVKSNNKSGVRGVSWAEKEQKWDARIAVDKKIITLGKHAKFEDAVAARKKAEKELCAGWTPDQVRAARPRGK